MKLQRGGTTVAQRLSRAQRREGSNPSFHLWRPDSAIAIIIYHVAEHRRLTVAKAPRLSGRALGASFPAQDVKLLLCERQHWKCVIETHPETPF